MVLIPSLTQWAVPFFLIISGALYASSMSRYGIADLMRKKVKSLVLPYLFWGGLSWLILGWGDWSFLLTLGIVKAWPTYNESLWFVRQILISMLVLGGLKLFFEKVSPKHYCVYFVVGAYLVLNLILIKWTNQVKMPASPFYFLIGWILSKQIFTSRKISCIRSCILVLGFVFAAIGIRTVAMHYCRYEVIARNTGNLMLIAGLWIAFDAVVADSKFQIPKFVIYTFGIYCMHPLILVLLSKMSLPLDIFRAMVCMVVCICIVLMTKYVMPRFSAIIFGGR